MTALLRALPLLAVVALSACGGQTGLLVRVDVPPEMRVGEDFDAIKVQITTETRGAFGDPAYPVTANTPTPYQVVVLEGEEEFRKVSVSAYLLKAGVTIKSKTVPDVTFEGGQIKEVIVDIE